MLITINTISTDLINTYKYVLKYSMVGGDVLI